MSISCGCDFDGDGWWYEYLTDFSNLDTKRSRKCCSCLGKIKPGETVMKFSRYRDPNSDIEERIYGDEINLAPWFMCEECGGMFMALEELNYCISLTFGEHMHELIKGIKNVD